MLFVAPSLSLWPVKLGTQVIDKNPPIRLAGSSTHTEEYEAFDFIANWYISLVFRVQQLDMRPPAIVVPYRTVFCRYCSQNSPWRTLAPLPFLTIARLSDLLGAGSIWASNVDSAFMWIWIGPSDWWIRVDLRCTDSVLRAVARARTKNINSVAKNYDKRIKTNRYRISDLSKYIINIGFSHLIYYYRHY